MSAIVMDITISGFIKGYIPHDYINIAKFNHFAITISSDNEILIKPFKFSNNYDGFYLLFCYLIPLE